MKKHEIVENKFTWVPVDKRVSRFGGSLPPRKAESRTPLLWLARSGCDLFLVNESEEILDFVFAGTGGFQTVDEDVMTVASKDQYEYTNVKPNSAVKVDEYDGFYDLDYVLQVSLKIQSKSLGCVDVLSPAKKGGVGETALLWDSNEAGKGVYIEQCS